MITIENMILESIASNCLVLLPSRILGLPFYMPSCNAFNATQNYRAKKKKCLHKSAEHFYFAKHASTGTLISDLRHTHGSVLESLLKRYLSINETHAYGMACPREPLFSIHIRSGDVTQGFYEKNSGQYRPAEVHQDYAPYPTSFYAQVLRKALEKENVRILIFCEDCSSPSCETIKTLSVSLPRVEMRVGMPLEEDLRLLACSKDVAISPGTFFKAFTVGSKHIYTFEHYSRLQRMKKKKKIRDSARCSMKWSLFRDVIKPGVRLTKYFISDEPEANEFERATKEWKNNDYQRHLVKKDYPMNLSVCSQQRM